MYETERLKEGGGANALWNREKAVGDRGPLKVWFVTLRTGLFLQLVSTAGLLASFGILVCASYFPPVVD